MGLFSKMGAAIGIASAIASSATGSARDKVNDNFAKAKDKDDRAAQERTIEVGTRSDNESKSGQQ